MALTMKLHENVIKAVFIWPSSKGRGIIRNAFALRNEDTCCSTLLIPPISIQIYFLGPPRRSSVQFSSVQSSPEVATIEKREEDEKEK